MAISHVFTNPVPDGTITSIVRPSDWNSAHNQYYTLSGNVLGASTVSGTNVVFQAGANVSLSGTGRTIVIQGTNTPQPTSYVSNVNGLSGAVSLAVGSSLSSSANGSSITFGLASNITTALQSANSNYLTTQTVQTQASGNIAGTGFTSTTTAGTAVVGTLGTGGLSVGVPAYLTTQSVQTQASGNIVGSGFTSTTTAGTAIVGTQNSQGLSLGVPAYLTTQSVQTQASGNIAGTGFTSTTTAGTAIVGTLNTGGLSIGVPAFLTAGGGGGGGVAIAGGTQTATSGTVVFSNSNGVTFGLNNGTLTASAAGAAAMYANLSGATSGNTTASGSTLNFSGINITLSGTNGSQIAISAPAASGLSNGNNIAISSTGSTIGISAQAVAAAAGTQTATSGTVNFANSNGISFGMSGSSQITASYTVPTQSVQTQASGNIAGSGFTGVNATGTLNSNGLSLSVAAPSAANYSIGVSNLGNTAGSTGITGTRIVFVGTNNISLSQSTDANGATISFDQTGGGGGGAMYANLSGATSGNTTASGNTLNFSGINVTLSGTNASQIAISAPATSAFVAGNNISFSTNSNTVNVLAQAVAIGANTQTATSGTVNFVNSNGITFGMSGSNQITASYTQRTTYALSASGGSSSYATLNFANSNGITFSNTGGSIRITHDLQYTSNTSAITSNAFPSADTTKFAGNGFTSTTTAGTAVQGTLSTNGLSLAIPAYLTAAAGGNFSGGVSNLGNTAGSTGITGTRIVFVGTNNISLSQSTDANGATISINQTGGGGGGGIAAAAGTQTATSGTVNFANSNGITFGMSGSNQITASYTVPTVPTSYVSNVNGSSGQISLNVGSSLSSSTNGSSITFGLASNITTALQSANANYLTSQSNQAFSASGGSSTFQTLNFANSNGFTFSNSGGSVVASYTVPTQSVQTQASGNIAGVGFTSTTTAGTAVVGTLSTNGLSLGVPAFITAGGGGGAMYANLSGATSGNTTASGNTLNFSGVNITLSGTNNSQIAISAPATSSLVAGNNISISTNGSTINFSALAVAAGAGTQTATSGTVIFSNANGISFGMSGSSRITASVEKVIASGYSPHGDYPLVVGEMGQGTLAFDPDIFPDLTLNQIAIPINFSHATNSTGSFTISNWVGLYSRNNSSVSLAHSTSFTTAITFSGTANSVSHVGMRLLTYPWSTSVSGGRYWIAQIMRTTTGGANCSFSQYLASQINSSFLGPFGVATNASYQFTLGQGLYSTSTTALPASIAYSQIRGAGSTTGSLGLRFPIVQFGFNTV